MAGSSTSIFTLIFASSWVVINAQDRHCPPSWEPFNNSCYFFNHDAEMSWTQASDACKISGSYLASIHSKEEQAFLAGRVRDGPSYNSFRFYSIGLNDRNSEGDFRWTDGTHVDYEAWNPFEPNDKYEEDCAGLWPYYGGKWNDFDCIDHHAAYICKTKPEVTSSTTSPLTSMTVTSTEKPTEEPTVMLSQSSTVVVPAVLAVIGLIIFAVCVFIALLMRRRRKHNARSLTNIELEKNGPHGYTNDVIPPKSPNEFPPRAPVRLGKHETQNDNAQSKDGNEPAEMYAKSEYGDREEGGDSHPSESNDYAYACPDAITVQHIDDDYAYATSESFIITQRDNQIESSNENEGWKDNEIYATENTAQAYEDKEGWANNSIYVDSGKVPEVKGQNAEEGEGWEDNVVYATK